MSLSMTLQYTVYRTWKTRDPTAAAGTLPATYISHKYICQWNIH